MTSKFNTFTFILQQVNETKFKKKYFASKVYLQIKSSTSNKFNTFSTLEGQSGSNKTSPSFFSCRENLFLRKKETVFACVPELKSEGVRDSLSISVVSSYSGRQIWNNIFNIIQWVTMKMEHIKNAKSPIRGCSVVQQVHILSLLRVLELKITRSLPTPGLCYKTILVARAFSVSHKEKSFPY